MCCPFFRVSENYAQSILREKQVPGGYFVLLLAAVCFVLMFSVARQRVEDGALMLHRLDMRLDEELVMSTFSYQKGNDRGFNLA
ncbi:unnamed protein product [Prunus armeniaca]